MLAAVPPVTVPGVGRSADATPPPAVMSADRNAFQTAMTRATDRAAASRAAGMSTPASTAGASAAPTAAAASGGQATQGVTKTSSADGIPAATAGTVVVHNGAELAQALASAKAGEHIVLADGTYAAPGGSFRLAASGTQGAPVVVEAEHQLGAHLTSSLTLAGSDQIASGLVFDRSSVEIAGDRSRVTGCASFGATGDAIIIRSGVDTRVDHCEISGGQRQAVAIEPDPAHPDALLRPVVDHNYVHDWAPVSQSCVHAAISIGECWRHDDLKIGAVIDSNLLEHINGAHCAIEAKSSGNTIRGNTLLDSQAGIVVRHGSDNVLAGNWVDGAGGIWVRGTNTLVVGNTVADSRGVGLRVLAGNVSADMPAKGYPAASGTVLIGNNVDRLLIGYGYAGSNHAATGTRIEGSQGTAPTLTGLAQDTIEVPASGEEIPTAVRLTAADVGPSGTSTLGSILAGYSGSAGSGGDLPVTVVGAPGDKVLAGMLGKSANSVHPSGNLDLSQTLAAMVVAQLNALMQQLDAAKV